jgi:DNA-binding PadR family transcriptional regulator
MPLKPDTFSFLPLKPRTFHVLLVLGDGPQHGYGIKMRVKEQTTGRIELEPGGLYRLIARLEQDGLVERSDPPADAPSTDPRRRYYELTPLGRTVLAEEAKRLTRLAALPEVVAMARSRR